MKLLTSCAILASALTACAESEPGYYANLTWEQPRTLSNWSNLTVETQTGTFIGMLNDTYPDVRQFLLVPYAQPPVGDLRWLPPQKLKKTNRKFDSTRYGPACPQYVSTYDSIWTEYSPTALLYNLGETRTQGSTAWSTAEDCLSLAIWTPASANRRSNLPVALFVTGGGGVTGGIAIPSQLPPHWVSRSQEHIVVTMNYRVNIFGNPKSRALDETSLTLLDVRAAVEWVYENIESFGGNKDNIMLWGQSQGAALTHLYTLAFPDDPLAAKFGILSQPPSVTIDLSTTDDVYQDFDIVAQALGCNYGRDATASLECMRKVSWVQISEFINRYNASPSISFSSYIPDEKYIFANETQRYRSGHVARGPAIRSNVDRESASTNLTASALTEMEWSCATAMDAALRRAIGLDTYRYFWAGNFTNISPTPWLGAYHSSDLLIVFGTYMKQIGAVPELEVLTSETMQDHFLAFMKDAASLAETVGWVPFDPAGVDGGSIVEFGKGAAARNVTGDWLDKACTSGALGDVRVWG
ncbi:carboxylesterase, type B [Aspergillus brunneoviolaceus CBS 621.78]|uniref:Carboxylesterase, type B n=1 Tax=Aspergillus brunneoviolaceus CBS 621.78 TaxID=1450534 RepID=A0ACD1FYP6_9EURO|nr:carboxylesterase, type B [Aspergillus brunneoviolaceus CBS 621.78]RAH42132.1 carboxylesterase, type B [Aspergillus brunneoviolaceus CBS 621.78]